MKKFILLILLISFSAHSQTNRFTGTWSNENCKNCDKSYNLNITIAQSNSKIFGTAEVVNNDAKLSTDVMEVTGYVSTMGEKAYINLKGKNNITASIVLYANEGALQFDKRSGSDVIPRESILTKLYE